MQEMYMAIAYLYVFCGYIIYASILLMQLCYTKYHATMRMHNTAVTLLPNIKHQLTTKYVVSSLYSKVPRTIPPDNKEDCD